VRRAEESQVIGLGLTTEIFNSNKAFAVFE
jgi:hypothetical protein